MSNRWIMRSGVLLSIVFIVTLSISFIISIISCSASSESNLKTLEDAENIKKAENAQKSSAVSNLINAQIDKIKVTININDILFIIDDEFQGYSNYPRTKEEELSLAYLNQYNNANTDNIIKIDPYKYSEMQSKFNMIRSKKYIVIVTSVKGEDFGEYNLTDNTLPLNWINYFMHTFETSVERLATFDYREMRQKVEFDFGTGTIRKKLKVRIPIEASKKFQVGNKQGILVLCMKILGSNINREEKEYCVNAAINQLGGIKFCHNTGKHSFRLKQLLLDPVNYSLIIENTVYSNLP